MGKRSKAERKRKKKEEVWEPDLENPVCPTCAGNDALEEADESGIHRCTRCNIGFWLEESDVEEIAGDETDDTCGACRGTGCHICLPSHEKAKLHSPGVPVLGEMVELT